MLQSYASPVNGKPRSVAARETIRTSGFRAGRTGGGRHFTSRGLRPAIIEKDYYVTEVLRIIANTAGDKVIFKGGTSLAKGWNLIERFSEDIDLFLDPLAFEPPLGKKAIDRELKKLRDAIGRHPAPDVSSQ